MIVENTELNRKIKAVADSMAIENMRLDRKTIEDLIALSKGEKTTEDIIREAVEKYGKK